MRTVEQRIAFYSQEKQPIESRHPENPGRFYKLLGTGQTVGEFEIDLGLGEDGVEIAQVTDCHLNAVNEKDMLDPETPYTLECRKAFRAGAMTKETVGALEGAYHSDAMIVTGDILDYMTYGTMDLVKELLTDTYPDVMMTVAWHDMTKQMQTKRPNLLTNEERIEMLGQIWPHDIHYCKRDIGKRITVLCLGNTLIAYSKDFSEQLLAEIQRARAEGRYILIFQHEPLATRVESDRERTPEYPTSNGYGYLRNFCDCDRMMARPDDPNELTHKIYGILTSNADVIKGIFAGHYHNQFYTEIPASYMKDGERVQTVLPQYVCSISCAHEKDGNGYFARYIFK